MSLTKLHENRGELVTAARSALDEINTNTDDARAADLESRHDQIMAEFDAIDAKIAREQKMLATEQRQNELNEERQRANNSRRPLNDTVGNNDQQVDDRLNYRHAFYSYVQSGGDLSAISNEHRGLLTSRGVNAESRAQLTTTGAAGGFTVPTELSSIIIKAMETTGPMYDDNLTFGISSSSGAPINIPGFDDTGDSSTAVKAEGAPLIDDDSGDMELFQRTLGAYVYTTPLLKWSMELGQDSIVNFESLLGELIGERMGKIANSKLTTGTGANEPNGVLTASTLGKTAASATLISFEEIMDLQHSVDPAYRGAAKFMCHDQTLLALRKVKDGDGNYLWTMGNVQTGAPDLILGQNVLINQAMPTIAAGARAILYGDFKKYFVRKVGSPVIGALRERFFPDTALVGLIRFDGEIGDSRAIKHYRMAV